MRAIVCSGYTGPRDLFVGDVPEPVAGPGQVLIEVHAAGVNFPDVLMTQGLYQTKPPLPFVPGVEAAGVVVAAGDGVTAPRTGQRVVAGVLGAFAQRATARASHTVVLPDAIDFATAAGMMMTYGTAYHALVDRALLMPGETLLVTGAGGGVGVAAVAIGKALGARVIAVASSEKKRAATLRAGADVALDATAEDLVERIKAESDGGFDVAIDNVGGAQFDAALRSARWRARLLVVGFASGTIPQIPANRLLLKELDIRGVYWGDWVTRDPEPNRDNFAALFERIEKGTLRPTVDATYAFEQAPQAVLDLMERRLVGKGIVVVRPDGRGVER
jgi:NADPH2:quinone reductase